MESAFAVKLKFRGAVITRHEWANSPEQACKKACPKRSNKRVLGVRKVRAEDVIGEVNEFKLIKEMTLGKAPVQSYGIIDEDTTLDSIVFSKKYSMNKNNNKSKQQYKKNKEVYSD